jgi:hypothetical protein
LRDKLRDRVTVSLITDAAEWETLFSRVRFPHMTQSWAYGEAKQAALSWRTKRNAFDAGGWLPRRIVFERHGETVAICQLLEKSVCGLHVASRVNRGPLFLGQEPSRDVIREVYAALRSPFVRASVVLDLAPALNSSPENQRLMSELGFRARKAHGWRSARLNLRLDEEQLRAQLVSGWRNRLRAAERSGLDVVVTQSPEDVEWLTQRHVENMREKDFSGPAPALVRALCDAAPNRFLVCRARLNDVAVGGMLIYCFGHTAELYIAWFGSEGRRVNVGNLVYWRSALELKRRGFLSCDLGGAVAGGDLGRFKQGMRAEPYQLLDGCLVF